MDTGRDAARATIPSSNLRFSSVGPEHRASRVLIVGNGPSLLNAPLHLLSRASHSGVYIIAVNRIVKWLPICHAFFTLDPDPYVLPILNVPKNDIVYWAAVPGDYGTPNARIMYHRVTRVHDHVNFLHRLAGNGPLHSHPTLSESPDSIHTGNSLYGALGLAYHMRPERIGFWGLDATAEDYAYGAGKPRGSLLHLPELFASSMAQLANRRISVLNGSKTSRVSCFPKATPDAVLEFLSQKSQVVQ